MFSLKPPHPFFSIKSTCCGWILLWEKSSDWSKPIDLFFNFVLHAENLSGFLVSCWIALLLLLLSKWLLPGDTYLSFSFFSFTLKRIMHFFWLSKGIPYKSRKIWLLERAMVICFFLNISPPKHCQSWFPPRLLKRDSIKGKQETMHFKYSAKISEEIDEGGAGCTQLR